MLGWYVEVFGSDFAVADGVDDVGALLIDVEHEFAVYGEVPDANKCWFDGADGVVVGDDEVAGFCEVFGCVCDTEDLPPVVYRVL